MDRLARLLIRPIGPIRLIVPSAAAGAPHDPAVGPQAPVPAARGHVGGATVRALLCAAAALAAIGLIWASPLAAVWAKAVADPLFHSTSSGAAVATLAFVVACALRWAVPVHAQSLALLRTCAVVLTAGVLLAHGANLAAHLALARDAGFPASVPFYHWQGADNSYSYLLHSHTGKAALHALAAGLLHGLAPSYDIGSALAGAVSPEVVAACAAGCILALIGTIWLLPAVYRRCGAAGVVFFAFCAWSCIKTSLDGGPLTYRFGPALFGLVFMLLLLGDAPQAWRRGLLRAALPAGLGYLAWWTAFVDEPGSEAIGGFGSTLALLALLGAWAWRAQDGRQRWTRRLVIGAAGLAVAGSVFASLVSNLGALLLPLPVAAHATACDLKALTCRSWPVGGSTALDVYRQAGDDALKPRHTMIAETPGTTENRLALVVHPLRTGAAQPATGLIRVHTVASLPGSGNVAIELHTTSLPRVFGPQPTPLSSRNYHVFLHLSAAQLRAQGLQGFVMAPLRHAADAAAFGLPGR